MNITIKKFDELSIHQLYAILALRSQVFVVEQDCVYQDLDGKDKLASHIMGFSTNGQLAAYTRVFSSGDYFKNASIGRVVVASTQRKYGYGKIIMQKSIDFLIDECSEKFIEISAQVYLLKFYNELGFRESGEQYLEDGIPHIKMYYTIGN
ncbi:GNAT family N-acetyltransferase [Flavobacterium sp. ASW18X]|uniref:GNAT family N-acetyltransferase n=1 Tax=Flavobacterium sp. ASW18X TaxID=2572595 RepID=UPI0010AEC683|nr:GNAT family N-acetyltransferase [Flavobacterium sp. ASW18X]TKD65132.1 GNAT family N-acetyltransferase [Flavobacterium sp. ASW18X]